MADLPCPVPVLVTPEAAAERLAPRYQLSLAQASELVRDGVQLGKIPAVIVDGYGNRRPAIPADLTDEVIGLGRIASGLALARDEGHGFFIGIVVSSCWAEIEFSDAAWYVASALDQAPPVDVKQLGGRPPVSDWIEAQAQAIERVWQYGLPASRGELTDEMLAWFDRGSCA